MKAVVYTEDEPPRFLGWVDLNVPKWDPPPPEYERDSRVFRFRNMVADTPLYRREPKG